jgi:hypothetical protein
MTNLRSLVLATAAAISAVGPVQAGWRQEIEAQTQAAYAARAKRDQADAILAQQQRTLPAQYSCGIPGCVKTQSGNHYFHNDMPYLQWQNSMIELDRQEQAAAEMRVKQAQAQQIEQQRQDNAKKAEKARIAALPVNRVLNGYSYYADVKRCHDVRNGYLVQYINDPELERATVAVKAIVEKATAEDTTVDTDVQWQKALAYANTLPMDRTDCQYWLSQLFAMSPVPGYTTAKP